MNTDTNITLGWGLLLIIAAIVLFILAIFLDEHQVDLIAAGLASFAASHIF